MIYLIWTIINGIIFLYFLYLISGFIMIGKRIFKPQFKTMSIVIMIIGIVNLISASSNNSQSNTITINEIVNGKYNSKSKTIKLEDNLTMDINLIISYKSDGDLFVPTSSYSTLTGFVGGYVWEFKSIKTNNFKAKEKVEYEANGILKWTLFGFNVYNQPKSFKGTTE